MKTVILVWKNHYTKHTCDDLFGLIRTTCFLYNLSLQMNFELYVDFQHHSISKCLPNPSHPYEKFILENKSQIPTIHDVDHYIRSSNSNILFFYTKTYLFINLYTDCKQFIRKLLHPPEWLQLKLAPIHVHDILHIHLNNPIISAFKYPHLLYTVYEKIKPYLSPNIIILSDTYEIKEYIKTEYPECIAFDTLIGNIGFDPHDTAVHDTLFDLHLMAKAKQIYSFSWSNTIPGFVKIMSLYNIPVYEIKIDQ